MKLLELWGQEGPSGNWVFSTTNALNKNPRSTHILVIPEHMIEPIEGRHVATEVPAPENPDPRVRAFIKAMNEVAPHVEAFLATFKRETK